MLAGIVTQRSYLSNCYSEAIIIFFVRYLHTAVNLLIYLVRESFPFVWIAPPPIGWNFLDLEGDYLAMFYHATMLKNSSISSILNLLIIIAVSLFHRSHPAILVLLILARRATLNLQSSQNHCSIDFSNHVYFQIDFQDEGESVDFSRYWIVLAVMET